MGEQVEHGSEQAQTRPHKSLGELLLSVRFGFGRSGVEPETLLVLLLRGPYFEEQEVGVI